MFRSNSFHKNTVGESEAPSLLQKEKRRSAKSDVSKKLFPDIGKITNWETPPAETPSVSIPRFSETGRLLPATIIFLGDDWYSVKF